MGGGVRSGEGTSGLGSAQRASPASEAERCQDSASAEIGELSLPPPPPHTLLPKRATVGTAIADRHTGTRCTWWGGGHCVFGTHRMKRLCVSEVPLVYFLLSSSVEEVGRQ